MGSKSPSRPDTIGEMGVGVGVSSSIEFNGTSVKNINMNSSANNNNDDYKRLTPKTNRPTSKTSRSIQRQESKLMEKQEQIVKKALTSKAENRVGNELTSKEVEELYHLGFFDNSHYNHELQPSGDVEDSQFFDLIDKRKKSCRGVKTKSLTASGEEASLSQVI
jgi:hypothetical protein